MHLRCWAWVIGQQEKVFIQRSFTTGQGNMPEGQHGMKSAQARRELSKGKLTRFGMERDFTTVSHMAHEMQVFAVIRHRQFQDMLLADSAAAGQIVELSCYSACCPLCNVHSTI